MVPHIDAALTLKKLELGLPARNKLCEVDAEPLSGCERTAQRGDRSKRSGSSPAVARPRREKLNLKKLELESYMYNESELELELFQSSETQWAYLTCLPKHPRTVSL